MRGSGSAAQHVAADVRRLAMKRINVRAFSERD
jgi:hypothetical protein